MKPDAAVRPHRRVDLRQEPLEEHERRFLSDPAPALVAGRQHRFHASGHRTLGLLQRYGAGEYPPRSPAREVPARLGDHEVDRIGKVLGPGLVAGMDAYAQPRDPRFGDGSQGRARGRGVPSKVERAQGSRAAYRDRESRIRTMEGSDAQNGRVQWSPPHVDSTLLDLKGIRGRSVTYADAGCGSSRRVRRRSPAPPSPPRVPAPRSGRSGRSRT